MDTFSEQLLIAYASTLLILISSIMDVISCYITLMKGKYVNMHKQYLVLIQYFFNAFYLFDLELP